MPETKKQKENRRHRQYEETVKMEQEDKNSYLREFLPKNIAPKFTMPSKNKVDIENFIELYPQYKKKVAETLLQEAVRGNINEKDFNDLNSKLNLLENDPKFINKYSFILKPNRYKIKTEKIFLR